MPMPLAHAVIGLTVYESLHAMHFAPPAMADSWRGILCIALVANAPDIDIVPWLRQCIRTWSCEPLGFKPHHREWTHSLLWGVIVGILTGLFVTYQWADSFMQWGLFVFTLYCSHIIADVLLTSQVEHGVQIFWPFTKTRHSLIRLCPVLCPTKPNSITRCLRCEAGIVGIMLILIWFF
jgi:membrane-bound metal-dependent hydrolase YbcI (DUF457 family)